MIEISLDPALLDIDVIHGYLSRSYWAAGIPREIVEKSIANSICFGAYENGKQVGFCRVITDRATFAWLADVFVLETHRGLGISKQLMAAFREHPDMQNIRRFGLVTKDAHGLYEQFGFGALSDATKHMEIGRTNMYLREDRED